MCCGWEACGSLLVHGPFVSLACNQCGLDMPTRAHSGKGKKCLNRERVTNRVDGIGRVDLIVRLRRVGVAVPCRLRVECPTPHGYRRLHDLVLQSNLGEGTTPTV